MELRGAVVVGPNCPEFWRLCLGAFDLPDLLGASRKLASTLFLWDFKQVVSLEPTKYYGMASEVKRRMGCRCTPQLDLSGQNARWRKFAYLIRGSVVWFTSA